MDKIDKMHTQTCSTIKNKAITSQLAQIIIKMQSEMAAFFVFTDIYY